MNDTVKLTSLITSLVSNMLGSVATNVRSTFNEHGWNLSSVIVVDGSAGGSPLATSQAVYNAIWSVFATPVPGATVITYQIDDSHWAHLTLTLSAQVEQH